MPAAAVIQEGQALFKIIGRKEYVDGKLINHLNIKVNFIMLVKNIY